MLSDRLSYSSIVPEDTQSELIGYGQTTTEICFSIGDIANQTHDGLMNTNQNTTQQFVCSAVGFFCGKSGRTVRHYASIANFFNKEVREKYSVLSFSHFSFAKQMNERWQEVLDYSVDDYIHSVDNVMEYFMIPEHKEHSTYIVPVGKDSNTLSYNDIMTNTYNTANIHTNVNNTKIFDLIEYSLVSLQNALSLLDNEQYNKANMAIVLIEDIKKDLIKVNTCGIM